MKTKIKNEVCLTGFCIGIGLAASLVIWSFLRVMELGIHFIWKWLPGKINISIYPLLICTLGGVIIGILHKKLGDYPEELDVVRGKIQKDNFYPYKNIVGMLLLALLPLLFGSSIGPEAGMAGVIAGLCYWAGDNLKFAYQNAHRYSLVGEAVTFGLLFHAPLFGIFSVIEDDGELEADMSKSTKIFVYGLTITAGTGGYLLLSHFFGGAMGLASFSNTGKPGWQDFLLLIVYISAGCILAWFYELTHLHIGSALKRLPIILRETSGGILLGIFGLLFPIIMFSGEGQMTWLMENYSSCLPLYLIAVAFLKVLLTNICIQSGLRGGHFFPIIFAGVSLGYGISLLFFGAGSGHEVFAVATVTGSLLGSVMKKPLAVAGLLLICFPVQLSVWIFLAACIGSRISPKRSELQ